MIPIAVGRPLLAAGDFRRVWRVDGAMVSAWDARREDSYASHSDLAGAVQRLAASVRSGANDVA